MSPATSENVPKPLQPFFDAIVEVTDSFCREHLTEEYAVLCRKLTAALCRKRPSPLLNGNLNTWVCGIVYTIGSQNFLFDRSQSLYMSASDLAGAFGLAKGTAGTKARQIRDLLKIRPDDWRWMLPSLIKDFSPAWFVEYNGIIIDARDLPLEVQLEAERRGLIPPSTRS